jgi:hypothetical protein
VLLILNKTNFCSVEAINIFTRDGILKVIGTVVCVSGAILMALYRGPSLIGLRSLPNAWTSTPYPAPNWFTSALLEYGVETWHLGVLCLTGNCLLVAVYLVIQVTQLLELAINPEFLSLFMFIVDDADLVSFSLP